MQDYLCYKPESNHCCEKKSTSKEKQKTGTRGGMLAGTPKLPSSRKTFNESRKAA